MARDGTKLKIPMTKSVQSIADLVVVAFGWTTALVLTNITETQTRSDARSLVLDLVAVVSTLFVMSRRGLYEGRPSLPRTEETSRLFVSVLAGAAATAVAANFLDWHIGAWEILVGSALVFGLRTIVRGVIRSLAIELPEMTEPTSVVIVGTGHEARELAEVIQDHPETRFNLIGVIGNLRVAERNGLADSWIGPTGRLIELMHQHMVTTAIVTTTGFRGEQFRSITKELFSSGYDVHLTTGISRMWEGRFQVRTLSHEPLIVMDRHAPARWQAVAKRVIDIIGASIALLLAAPVMAAAAVLIWFEDRGPITYSSRRIGVGGSPFRMYKFRSMVTNADELKKEMAAQNERTGPLFKVSNDPRITRIGRLIRETSIDELPQLFNVLKGDMSLVGPRPALPEEEEAFDDELKERFRVRPGITGLWQVEARSNAAFNAYRRLDLHYVENWTVGLDLRILLATAEQVVVSVALIPLRMFRKHSLTDGIETAPRPGPGSAEEAPVVIDLRDRSRARMAAAAAGRDDLDDDRPTGDRTDQSSPAIS